MAQFTQNHLTLSLPGLTSPGLEDGTASRLHADVIAPASARETRRQEGPNPLLDFLEVAAAGHSHRAAVCSKGGTTWRGLSYGELWARTRGVTATLIEIGLRPGDRVGILSGSGPEWGVAFLGSLGAGAVVVPLDPKLTETELASILNHCAARLLFVSPAVAQLADRLQTLVPRMPRTLVLEPGIGNAARTEPQEPPAAARPRTPGDTAVIVYTSAMTSPPRGVVISYANLIFQVRSLARVVDLGAGDHILSILPLNHLLELTGGFLVPLSLGATICYAHSLFPQHLVQLMREKSVSAMIGVPVFFESLRRHVERELRAGSPLARIGFRFALRLAALMPWRRARRALCQPLHGRLGGRLRMFISGGAPLDPEVARFFDRLGLPILQGYGLTETSPVISVNTMQANRIGSVGRPLEGVEVKIDGGERGEILTRGPHVMKGYYRCDDLTREVIDRNGWLHTGDLGRIDHDGFLHITGRRKSLIVLDSGKKVDPEEVERCLAKAATIAEVCVVGRRLGPQAEEVCVVAVPAEAVVGRRTGSPADPEKVIRDEIARLARDLAPYKRPSRVYLHSIPLPRTPAREICRHRVQGWLHGLECRPTPTS
jgi:long-chain acyl-CoA synthetase